MTVAELISELQRWPSDASIHIDVSADEERGWDGDRVVRTACGVRHQEGYYAIAIDAGSWGETEFDKTSFKPFDGDIIPSGKSIAPSPNINLGGSNHHLD